MTKGKKASVKAKKTSQRTASSTASKAKASRAKVAAKKVKKITTTAKARTSSAKGARVIQKAKTPSKPTRAKKASPKTQKASSRQPTVVVRKAAKAPVTKKKTVVTKPVAPSKKPRAVVSREASATAYFSGNKTNMSNTKSRATGTSTHLGTMGVPPYEEKRGEVYMNDDQLLHFRKILRLWKQELMEEVDRTVHHMQDEASNFPDPNDRATQEEEFSLELRTRDRERKLIRKIDEALQKIENQDYGYCDSCGIEIGIRRLEARPTANLCIDCKILDEIKERQVGGEV